MFYGCDKLEYIEFNSVPSLPSGYQFGTKTIHVLPSLLDSFAISSYWKSAWSKGYIVDTIKESKYNDISMIDIDVADSYVGFASRINVLYNGACNPEQKGYTYSLSDSNAILADGAIVLKDGEISANGTITITSTYDARFISSHEYSLFDTPELRNIVVNGYREDELKDNDIAISQSLYDSLQCATNKRVYEIEAQNVTNFSALGDNNVITNLDCLYYFNKKQTIGNIKGLPNLKSIILSKNTDIAPDWYCFLEGCGIDDSVEEFKFKTYGNVIKKNYFNNSCIGFAFPSNYGTLKSKVAFFIFENFVDCVPQISNTKGTTWGSGVQRLTTVIKRGTSYIHSINNAKNGSNANLSSNHYMYINSDVPPTLSFSTSSSLIYGSKIFVPIGSRDSYISTTNWSTMADIIEEYDFEADIDGVMSL